MKDFSYYSTARINYPCAPRQPVLDRNASVKVIKEYADSMEKFEILNEEFKILFQEYRDHLSNLEGEFYTDTLEELGLTNHPKASRIFQYAWDQSHSYGHQEVFQTLKELAELFLID